MTSEVLVYTLLQPTLETGNEKKKNCFHETNLEHGLEINTMCEFQFVALDENCSENSGLALELL